MSNNSSDSWRRKMGRSRSAGSAQRSSPPNEIPPASPRTPRTTMTTTTGDGSITPPHKSWEKHYRSFLTRRVLGGSSPRSSSASTVSMEDDSGSGRNGKFPGSRLFRIKRSDSSGRLTPPIPPPPPPPFNTTSSSSSGPPPDSSSTTAAAAAAAVRPDNTINMDSAVRGGSFFQSVFHRERTSSNGDIPPSPVPPQRRIKSMDTLDSTLRGGLDKQYSPLNERYKNHASATAMEDDLPVRNGIVVPPKQHRLPTALLSKHRQSREMKKAFTEFHNSAQFALDSSSPYLGDDPSIRQSNYLAMPKRTSVGAQSERNLGSLLKHRESSSLPLETVNEDVAVDRSMRILKPVQGPETWETGRRYLIAPAALSTCPLQVVNILSGSLPHLQSYNDTAFGIVDLGKATVKYVGTKHHDTLGWSNCVFSLHQNYLLEYAVDSTEIPRGFAHLQYANCYPHPDFPDALELEFYASPCARSDKRVLFIRVASREERDRWVMCLNDAAQLTIADLYDYNEEKEFGRGRYAAVYPARRKGPPDDSAEEEYQCALKIIDKNEFWRRVVKGMERADTIVRETSVQATLTAKCGRLSTFLKLKGIFETSNHFVIELELLEGIDLFRHVSSKGVLPEDEAAQIMQDILTSLDAISRIGLAHRDIKPANVLMCDKEKCGCSVKVADFGMSTFAGVDGHLRGRCGTPGYVAPEIFTAAVHGGYGNKVDVFSAGVTLYVMLCGYEPFYGESDAELIAANKAADVEFLDSDWSRLSPEALDLVEKMLERDPKKRISAKEALEHPWINTKQEKAQSRRSDHNTSLTSSDIKEGAACIIS